MRVLPGVEHATFESSSSVFSVRLRPGAPKADVLDAIEACGYEPSLLDAPPSRPEPRARRITPRSTLLKDALARARERDVPLLVVGSGSFCMLSSRLEQTTLADARIRRSLAELDVLRLDLGADPDAARDLQVHAVPAVWLLDGDGRVLVRHEGFVDVDELEALLARGAP